MFGEIERTQTPAKNYTKSSIPFGGDSVVSAQTNGKTAVNLNGVASVGQSNGNGQTTKATNGNGEAYLNGNGTKHGKLKIYLYGWLVFLIIIIMIMIILLIK